MNINFELYKVFYYVAKNSSISRAANEMMISQPAISKSIKTLEAQVGTPLFIRKRDGVILSEAGETIYNKIKDAVELIVSAENDLDALTNMDTGVINIGASKTILHEFLMPYIKSFHKKYPKVNIRIFTDKTDLLLKKSKMGLIDVIFTNMPYNIPNNFDSFKLMDLHDCFVASQTFKYLKDRTITKNDLEKLPLLVLTKGASTRIRLDEYCTDNNIVINPEMEFGSNTLIKDFTLAGFGIGMLSEEHIKDELEDGTLFKLNIELPLKEKYLGMIYDYSSIGYISKNFIKYIKEAITK